MKARSSGLCLAAFLTFLSVAAFAQTSSDDTSAQPGSWTPRAEYLGHLGAPTTVGGYTLRLPANFVPMKAPDRPDVHEYCWHGTTMPAALVIGLIPISSGLPPDLLLKYMVVRGPLHMKDFVTGPVVHGLINSRLFARQEFEAVTLLSGIPVNVRGFIYASSDERNGIAIIGVGMGANRDAQMGLLDASAVTFK